MSYSAWLALPDACEVPVLPVGHGEETNVSVQQLLITPGKDVGRTLNVLIRDLGGAGVLPDIEQRVASFKLMHLIVDVVGWVLDRWETAVLAGDVKQLNTLTNNLASSEPRLYCCKAVLTCPPPTGQGPRRKHTSAYQQSQQQTR